ncbi:S41 family peptidase [Psychrobacter sp. 16-MNA-CIBAN-0192]|uniref:S41 family peptidase n=1 Tax=Psychrobacter sp. 16-MNA-CIBAN-0192 TaxID=3140448 RepID=UPI0033258673
MRLFAHPKSCPFKLSTPVIVVRQRPLIKIALFGLFGMLNIYSHSALAATSMKPPYVKSSTVSTAKNKSTTPNKAASSKSQPAKPVQSKPIQKKPVNAIAIPIKPRSNQVAQNPTAGLHLSALKNEQVSPVDNIDLTDSAAVGVQSDDWIDAVQDTTAISSDSNMIQPTTPQLMNTDIPASVAHVSLNAISPETLQTFVSVVDLIRREYVVPVNDEVLFNNAMSGMLTNLDSHAEFLDAAAYDNLRAFTEGDVGDVGLQATYDAKLGYWVVTTVKNNSSADNKGIAVGDYLHQIDAFKLDENKLSNDVQQLLTGIAGTQVDVVTSKAGRRKHSSTLQRNNMHAQAIETRLVDGIAIVKLPAFQNNSREQILKSLTELNAPVSAILLDLRDNPGGVLTSAVQVASLFMEDTKVVQVRNRQPEIRTLTTRGNAVLKPLPVMILQNRYSASAAEVLASSLQTQKRATIVGEVSYGKGSVQSVIPLNNEQAVKLTVAHYLTATGMQIEKIGVQPDVRLSGNEGEWEQQALALLRKQISSSGIRFVQGTTKSSGSKTADTMNKSDTVNK